MNDPKGNWIKVNRALSNHWIWNTGEPFTKGQAWVDLLLLAYHSDDDKVINGQVKHIKRGQVPYSKLFLARRWKWSIGKVSRFCTLLVKSKMCSVNSTTDGTTITIENYEFWQDARKTNRPSNGKQTENKRKTNGNIKEYKEEKEYKEYKENPPSFLEISSYIISMNYDVNPKAFFDYYEDSGWLKKNGQPVKNWKASVRAWHEREQRWKQEQNKSEPKHYPKFKTEEYEQPGYGEQMPDYMKETVKRLKGGGGNE